MPEPLYHSIRTLKAGARTSRPLLFAPRYASIVSEISMGGNAADETSALRYEAIPPLPVTEEW